MQIAHAVTRANAKNPRSVKFDHMKMEFRPTDSSRPKSKAQVKVETAFSKARWAAILGKPVEEVGKNIPAGEEICGDL